MWCGEKRGRAQRSEKARRGETLRKELGGGGAEGRPGKGLHSTPWCVLGVYTTHAAGRWGESLWRLLEI